jgi:hypothetical protein
MRGPGASSVRQHARAQDLRLVRGSEGTLMVPHLPASNQVGEIVLTVEGSGKPGCILFEVHLAIVPIAAVQNTLACPREKPVPALPPKAMRIYTQQKEYHSAGDKYMLQGSDVRKHSSADGKIAYDMLVKVEVEQASMRAVCEAPAPLFSIFPDTCMYVHGLIEKLADHIVHACMYMVLC